MFMLSKMYALRSGGDAGYVANAVDFDGTNDYLSKAGGFTGQANNPQGIFSAWVRLDGSDGSQMRFVHDDSNFCEVTRLTNNRINFNFWDSAGTSNYNFRTVNSYTSAATWLHILASWDTNFAAVSRLSHLYINDVSDKTIISNSGSAMNIRYASTTWGVAASISGGDKLNGCLAEVYFAMGQFLDFSNSANRRKFISGTGKPVSLGSDGSLPTGVAPTMYLNNPAVSFATNKGTGGNLSLIGTLDPASTSPSD